LRSTHFPYTTLFRSDSIEDHHRPGSGGRVALLPACSLGRHSFCNGLALGQTARSWSCITLCRERDVLRTSAGGSRETSVSGWIRRHRNLQCFVALCEESGSNSVRDLPHSSAWWLVHHYEFTGASGRDQRRSRGG